MKTTTLMVFVAFVSVASCILPSKDNPATCQTNGECASGVCNLATYQCEPIGGVDSGQPQGGTGGAGGTTGTGGVAGAVADGSDEAQPDGSILVDAPIDQRFPDAAVDTRVPDAAGTCGVNGDCTDPTKAFCVAGVCAGCQSAGASSCVAPTPACDLTSGKCVGCTADSQCTTDPAKGFCVAGTCTGCNVVGATGCAARTDGKSTCATSGAVAGQCVACLADAQCNADPAKGFCVANVCTGCNTTGATGCSTRADGKIVCATIGTAAGQCVQCTADTQCNADPAKGFCVANVCTSCNTAGATGCTGRTDGKAVCATTGTVAGQCVACVADAQCTADPTKGFCVANVCTGCNTTGATGCSVRTDGKTVCATTGTLAGRCVGCVTSTDCSVLTTPICNSVNTCVGCTADTQCVAKLGTNPGVCMAHQDARCATDTETLYVASVTSCLPSGATAGTSGTPLCGLQAAVTLMTTDPTRHLIVLRSSADPISVTNATQVSIVGQSTASVTSTGTTPGITLSGAGNLYARDLSVIGSIASNIGISAGPGTTLRLERVKVLNNGGTSGGGGILLNGAAFDFEDVLVSGNGTGQDGAVSWSGIYVKALPSTGITKLNLVSIVNNGGPGMTCTIAAAGPNTGVYASANGGGVNIANLCGITACTPAAVGACGSSLTQ